MRRVSIFSVRYVKERECKYEVLGSTAMSTPKTVVDMMNEIFGINEQAEEYMYLLSLNTKNHITDISEFSHGGLSSTIAEPREIFKRAIVSNAKSIILVHNHPSGDPHPSLDDRQITDRIKKCGELLGIKVHDHIIIGGERYMSFKENMLL